MKTKTYYIARRFYGQKDYSLLPVRFSNRTEAENHKPKKNKRKEYWIIEKEEER